MSSIRGRCAGSWRTGWSSTRAWCTLKVLRASMRSLLFLLISAAGAAAAAPPPPLELGYEVSRNGSTIAEIVQNLEYGNGRYQLTESWQGRGLFRLLGNAK